MDVGSELGDEEEVVLGVEARRLRVLCEGLGLIEQPGDGRDLRIEVEYLELLLVDLDE